MRICHVSTFYPPSHFGGDAILKQSIGEGLVRRYCREPTFRADPFQQTRPVYGPISQV